MKLSNGLNSSSNGGTWFRWIVGGLLFIVGFVLLLMWQSHERTVEALGTTVSTQAAAIKGLEENKAEVLRSLERIENKVDILINR